MWVGLWAAQPLEDHPAQYDISCAVIRAGPTPGWLGHIPAQILWADQLAIGTARFYPPFIGGGIIYGTWPMGDFHL